ncbi:MAG: DUF5330 domain-containing protein [Mesorhizobium sp.]|nr:DUF5330 domain-containing protein [Mesorhizobium sp.]MBL8578986.1 DUF5330 domain-containing protein [Mesorhizobium sp.]
MGFLIRMAFWFSVVLLVLPLDPAGDNGPGVNPIQAFFAAKEAVDDMAAICERKPDVCDVGKAAMHTIGTRAKESARLAYEMLEANGTAEDLSDDGVGALINAEALSPAQMDKSATGSVPASD